MTTGEKRVKIEYIEDTLRVALKKIRENVGDCEPLVKRVLRKLYKEKAKNLRRDREQKPVTTTPPTQPRQEGWDDCSLF